MRKTCFASLSHAEERLKYGVLFVDGLCCREVEERKILIFYKSVPLFLILCYLLYRGVWQMLSGSGPGSRRILFTQEK